ncbi:unnamed protein product [Gadus morhua 'NCC']
MTGDSDTADHKGPEVRTETRGTLVLGEALWTGPLALLGTPELQGGKGTLGTSAPQGLVRPDAPATQATRAERALWEKQGPLGYKVSVVN